MKYTFDPDTYLISSEDGSVVVDVRSADREGVWSFVLGFRGKRFGFETGVTGSKDEASRIADGTVVWRICRVCVPLSTMRDPRRSAEEFRTDATCFADRVEQDEALRVFAEALVTYDSDLKASAAGLAKARVEYGKNVLRNIESGAYLA